MFVEEDHQPNPSKYLNLEAGVQWLGTGRVASVACHQELKEAQRRSRTCQEMHRRTRLKETELLRLGCPSRNRWLRRVFLSYIDTSVTRRRPASTDRAIYKFNACGRNQQAGSCCYLLASESADSPPFSKGASLRASSSAGLMPCLTSAASTHVV